MTISPLSPREHVYVSLWENLVFSLTLRENNPFSLSLWERVGVRESAQRVDRERIGVRERYWESC